MQLRAEISPFRKTNWTSRAGKWTSRQPTGRSWRREQNQLIKQRARVVAHGSADAIAGAAKGNLVRLQNGNLVSCYDDELAPKQIYGLYFSAHWCPPCRKFTPQLVAYYNQIALDHP